MSARNLAPVFVIGSPRSGTTLFYHMLLSAGDFAVYRAEANVFNMLAPRFGDPGVARNREALLAEWLPSEFFKRAGLDAAEFRARVSAGCRNAGDFLRIFMESIAEKQKVRRWSECTPDNLLFLDEIKRTIPDAIFVHIIRDGRDVALSLAQQGWIRPFSRSPQQKVLASALFWEWIVAQGRESGRRYAQDYREVSFEALITRPRETLAALEPFLEHDLNYDRIQQTGIGSVSRPNTSFRGETQEAEFNPVGRWKKSYTAEELARLESLIGGFLGELGYALESPRESLHANPADQLLRALYRLRFEMRHWLKAGTPLGRVFTNTDLLRDFHAADQDRMEQSHSTR
ncbi:MAG: sulfotransferase [Acidobacteria bacterium]|nr:sulfotransferase [Acidobacteriota bacterium]